MGQRQHTNPLLIAGDSCRQLRRVPLSERSKSEAWFQDLLFRHPELIPVEDIEPIFAPLIPVAREMPTSAGPVDLVFVSPAGYVTVVETKLWRNPEARRKVVAQVMDYAAAMSKWTYEDFAQSAGRAGETRLGSTGVSSLVSLVGEESEIDEAEFIDTISRNLAKGRLLLLIAGDGIQEGVEHLTGTLARSPQLGFSLALLEVALFRPADSEEPLIVQPRLLARTREVVRAVVEIRAGVDPASVAVTLPVPDEPDGGPKRQKLTEEVFLEKLAKSTDAGTADQFRDFLTSASALEIVPTGRDASLSLFWFEPTTGRRFTLGSVGCKGGELDTRFVHPAFWNAELDVAIAEEYLQTLSGLGKGMVKDRKMSNARQVWVGNRLISLTELLPRQSEWLAAIQQLISRTQEASSGIDG